MSDLEHLINEYIVTENHTSLAVKLQKYSLLSLIKSLEDPLTQEDGNVRALATKCLVDVVRGKPLNSIELKVLSQFFLDRMQDFYSMEISLAGLSYISQKKQFTIELSDEILLKIRELDMLNLEPESRLPVFQYFDQLTLGTPSVIATSFVMVASGEKDPRNLMLSLKITDNLLSKYDLEQNIIEQLYDISFCYFPVKFNPPRDMPYKITADEIKERLNKTISNSKLNELVVPALLSKLSAVSVQVRLDSLNALDLCTKQSTEMVNTVFDGIKFEILHGTPESETFAPSINVLKNFSHLIEFQTLLLNEFNTDLSNNKLYQLCCIVVGISTTESVWNAVVPQCILKTVGHLPALILFLKTPFKIPHLDDVFQTLQTAFGNGNKKESVLGLKRIALSANGKEYVPLIVQMLTESSEFDILTEIAVKYPGSIEVHCVPMLLNEFPNADKMRALAKVCSASPSLVLFLFNGLVLKLDLKNPNESFLLLLTLVEASKNLNLKTGNEFIGLNRIVLPILTKFSGETNEKLIVLASVLLERASRGVLESEQLAYTNMVFEFNDKVHFHLILSSLVSMKKFPFSNGFIEEKLNAFKTCNDKLEKTAILRLLAVTVNKWQPLDIPFSQLELYAMATKGLLLKTDPTGFANAETLLKHSADNINVAEAFGTLVTPDRLLTKLNGCIVRPLYKQRLFVNALPFLKKGTFESLVALSSLLKHSEPFVLKQHFNEILPMLISSLQTSNDQLQLTAVQTLCASMPECGEFIVTELSFIVPKLLEIGKVSRIASARAASFKTLCALTKSLKTEMTQFKETIQAECVYALGDPNRDVRKYAVKCRQMHF